MKPSRFRCDQTIWQFLAKHASPGWRCMSLIEINLVEICRSIQVLKPHVAHFGVNKFEISKG